MAKQAATARHLILFDGECGFCRNAVISVARLDPKGAFRFASLDSDLAQKLLADLDVVPSVVGTMYVLPEWEGNSASALDRSRAALFIARRLEWPWKGAAALGILPRCLLDRCYDAVARNRHLLAGGDNACAFPDTSAHDRFLS